jgi:hypothetical protein
MACLPRAGPAERRDLEQESQMFATVLIMFGLLAADGPDMPAAKPDLAAYEAARTKAGRDPEAQVKLALWCEAHGLDAERIKHLTLATLIDPANAGARAMLGLVQYQGKWARPDEISRSVQDDPARRALLREYMERRVKAAETADDQWKLALWCDQAGLADQAAVHFLRVVKLDPRREAAWRRLGYKRTGGRWVKPEVLTAEKAELEAQARADKLWKPRLDHWRDGLKQRDKAGRAFAESALGQITDPRAVPMVWMTFARGDASSQGRAVTILSQIDAPGASRALAMLALFSPVAEVRQAAKEILRRRDPREFAGLVVGMFRQPVKFRSRPIDRLGAQGELLVEGKEADLRRLYTPSQAPTLQPGDQLGTDAQGMLWANRVFGSYWVPAGYGDRVDWASLYPAADAGRVSQVLQQAGLPAAKSQQVGQAVAHNTQAAISALPTGGMPMEFYRYIVEGMLLPVGPMMQDARASTAAAERQLAADVQALEAYNAPIELLNGRARELLTDVSGQDHGADRQAWERWYVDLLGYAYGSPTTPSRTERPTVVEQVPLDHEAQAPPKIAYQGPSNVSFIRYSCFGAGTPVTTLQGRRPIEDLRAGDVVLARDTATGVLAYRPHSAVFHNPPDSTYRIDTGGEPIVATGIHRFWKAGEGWIMARDLRAGDRLRTIGGVARVRSVAAGKVQPVFNLQVSGGDNFFVGTDGVLAHDNSLVTPAGKPFDRVSEIEAPVAAGERNPR